LDLRELCGNLDDTLDTEWQSERLWLRSVRIEKRWQMLKVAETAKKDSGGFSFGFDIEEEIY
jgi:hypothetical protein